VAGHAQRLQVGSIKACATFLDRLNVIHNLGRNNATGGLTGHTQRVCGQVRGTHSSPIARLIEADFGIEAATFSAVVTVDDGPVCLAVAGHSQHG
jgi:hypothetical protein